ncbi:Imidazoleglycerol-phosphate dehydratase [Chthoniobacter flavus Ellin428]|uniref:Imidazoleglycerol-phosphate dehydratase n=1 Tax=Chthoniobacter flavus Ellin428 TaxID=497964 RepID=B4CY26_9BACT|nr:imidazoleglycerol-phosphate dehydratase HisB [Chthoniobacter flavus]EDY21174.1 Imidazoleglycerol-phosphate dehydratase [Chthoniobacter flavus Ellin428]TCO87546.1 imidazoleglycerol-phosphate dehydratase [Chthoniobacter flavus]
MTSRQAQIDRRTSETKIQIDLRIDGRGTSQIATKIPFFDHMLTLFSRHSLCDLTVNADGDVEVDFHHTVEDVGIALGQAFTKALGDKRGIRRYGWAYLPMDETLARVVIDFSGRPFLHYKAPEGVASIGGFSFTLLEEFLRAFCTNAAVNLHVEILYGRDAHHMCEAVFKGLAKAVDQACQLDPRVEDIPSTKGTL